MKNLKGLLRTIKNVGKDIGKVGMPIVIPLVLGGCAKEANNQDSILRQENDGVILYTDKRDTNRVKYFHTFNDLELSSYYEEKDGRLIILDGVYPTSVSIDLGSGTVISDRLNIIGKHFQSNFWDVKFAYGDQERAKDPEWTPSSP